MTWEDWFSRRKRRVPFDIDLPFHNPNDLEVMMREFERRIEDVFKEVEREVPEDLIKEKKESRKDVKEMGPFVYGYSINIGPDGKPVIRQFGNVKSSDTKPGFDVKDVREPLVEVVESEKYVTIVMELPGVDKKDIKINSTEKTISINVDTSTRKYSKELELPSEVDPHNSKSNYKNGILEIKMSKISENSSKGVDINVE